MHRTIALTVVAAVFVLNGCRSHEANVADLQKQYDAVNQQFAKDCSAEMMNLPRKLSPKCADESRRLKEATERLQAARAKQ
jgi:protein involved in sex pheromone biosynthesis